MMPTSELITTLRTKSMSLEYSCRFLVLDMCDRLERKTRDNELLMQKIAELRHKTVKTHADRIRAMSDEELCKFLGECKFCDICQEGCDNCTYNGDCDKRLLEWLKQPAEEGVNDG